MAERRLRFFRVHHPRPVREGGEPFVWRKADSAAEAAEWYRITFGFEPESVDEADPLDPDSNQKVGF